MIPIKKNLRSVEVTPEGQTMNVFDKLAGITVYDPTTNYCGPGYSDGKVQGSVIGGSLPTSDLDSACHMHDAQYAMANGNTDMMDHADAKFYDRLSGANNKSHFMDPRPFVYKNLVYYGNKILRKPNKTIFDDLPHYEPGTKKHTESTPPMHVSNDGRVYIRDKEVSQPSEALYNYAYRVGRNFHKTNYRRKLKAKRYNRVYIEYK